MAPSVQSLIDLILDPVLLVGRDGAVLHTNRAFERAVGLRRSGIVGQPLADVVATPAEDLAAYLRRCSGSLQPLPGALAVRDAENSTRYFRANGAATLTDDGSPGPIMLRLSAHEKAIAEFSLLNDQVKRLSQEILRRKHAEEELRRSEERFRLAVEAADMGTWDLDAEAGQVKYSTRCSELLRTAPEDSTSYDDFIASIHKEDQKKVHLAIQAALANSEPSAFAVEYRTAHMTDGRDRWIAHRGKALFDNGRAVRAIGMVLDITEARQTAEHQRLLINELNHRVKNTLATVHSISMQTLRHSSGLDQFSQAFEARLMALSQTHNLLTHSKWMGAALHDLLAAETAPFQDGNGSRLRAVGPTVHLAPKAVVALGLAFHELITNAVKYGALSTPDGYVEVSWAIDDTADSAPFSIVWTEVGGPAVDPPKRRGFGSRLLERGLAYDLGAVIKLHFLPTGVKCLMDLPRGVLEQNDGQE